LPASRKMFVAPGFPEPRSLGSPIPANRDTKIAVEIDPNRYAPPINIASIILAVGFFL